MTATVQSTKDTCSSPVYSGELLVFISNLPAVATPQDRIIEQLEANSGLLRNSVTRLKLEIFELKGEIKILKGQLKVATAELQKQQGYYDDEGNYVE